MSLDVEDVLGISIPFVLLFMSSIALGWAVEPSVLIAKLCVKPVRGSSPDVAILIKKKRKIVQKDAVPIMNRMVR